jgi:hypothetical protein
MQSVSDMAEKRQKTDKSVASSKQANKGGKVGQSVLWHKQASAYNMPLDSNYQNRPDPYLQGFQYRLRSVFQFLL